MKVIDVIDVAPQVRTIRLERPKDFSYKPGQFLLVSMQVNGEMRRRAYSIASSPTEPDYVDITFKKVAGGMVSPRLYDLSIGDELDAKGPYGLFTLDETHLQNLVLVGGGTGITPLRSIMKFVVDKKLENVNISLIYGARTPLDLVYHDEIQAMHANHSKIRIFFTIEQDGGEPWPWHRGMVSVDFIKESVPDYAGCMYYLCGPPLMIEHLLHELVQQGVDPRNIHVDRW
ncbi:MAG: FAD-binding oxidoreductase [archaeon]